VGRSRIRKCAPFDRIGKRAYNLGMKTTRRDFIKLALAGILALFTARFSKPSVVEKWDWDALEDWGAAYPSTLDDLAGFEIDDYADMVEFTRNGVMWYVSKDGDDANSGKSPDDAFLTSGAALRAVTRNYSSLPHCPIIFEVRSKCQ